MIGIDMWLSQLTGGNEALAMMSASALLIFMSFATGMAVEVKNKDLKWNDLGRFSKLLLLNAIFLFGLELLMVPTTSIPMVYEFFLTVQMAGWLGVTAFYFYEFYKNLRKLGMQANNAVEEHIQNLVHPSKEEQR